MNYIQEYRVVKKTARVGRWTDTRAAAHYNTYSCKKQPRWVARQVPRELPTTTLVIHHYFGLILKIHERINLNQLLLSKTRSKEILPPPSKTPPPSSCPRKFWNYSTFRIICHCKYLLNALSQLFDLTLMIKKQSEGFSMCEKDFSEYILLEDTMSINRKIMQKTSSV